MPKSVSCTAKAHRQVRYGERQKYPSTNHGSQMRTALVRAKPYLRLSILQFHKLFTYPPTEINQPHTPPSLSPPFPRATGSSSGTSLFLVRAVSKNQRSHITSVSCAELVHLTARAACAKSELRSIAWPQSGTSPSLLSGQNKKHTSSETDQKWRGLASPRVVVMRLPPPVPPDDPRAIA